MVPVVVDPVSALLSVLSLAASRAISARSVAAAQAAAGGAAAAVVAVQLATIVYLHGQFAEIKSKLSSMNGALVRIEKKVDQIQRLQFALTAAPIHQAVDKLVFLALPGPVQATAHDDLGRAIGLMEKGRSQVTTALKNLDGYEVVELIGNVEPLLAALDVAAVCETAMLCAAGGTEAHVRLVLSRYQLVYAGLAEKVERLGGFDLVAPTPAVIAAARAAGAGNPSQLRRLVLAQLNAKASDFQLAQDMIVRQLAEEEASGSAR